jgi:putative redox protein
MESGGTMAEEGSHYSATATWVNGLQFVAQAHLSGVAAVLDGAPEVGGTGAGMRPLEALLVSLITCTAMDVISILRKKRERVTGFKVHARGDRQDEHPRVFTDIEIEFVVRGYGISETAVARAIELSQTKYCSVTNSLKAHITYTYRIETEEPPS